ncbi:MAG TPA: CapA family protein [Spirillospora sp.]|nr:CapA family protein [Spirillospora sp.]
MLHATARARARGAAIVIVSLHWGQEYRHAPTDEQREPPAFCSPHPTST